MLEPHRRATKGETIRSILVKGVDIALLPPYLVGADLRAGRRETLFADRLDSDTQETTPNNVGVDRSWGFNTRIGFRMLPRLAAEVRYEWMKGFEVDVATFKNGEFRPHTFAFNPKLMIVPAFSIRKLLASWIGRLLAHHGVLCTRAARSGCPSFFAARD